jgi:hypothetical protein
VERTKLADVLTTAVITKEAIRLECLGVGCEVNCHMSSNEDCDRLEDCWPGHESVESEHDD